MFPCKIAFRQLSPEFSFYRIPLFEACSRRASARPFLSAIRKVCLAKLLPFQVITPAKEKDFSSISHHYKFKLNSVFSLVPCSLDCVVFLWLRRGSFCEAVSMETLRKHRKNWPSWNKHSEIHFVVLLWTVIVQAFLFFLVLRLKCFISHSVQPRPPLRHRVAPSQGGGLCFLHSSTSRTVVPLPLVSGDLR